MASAVLSRVGLIPLLGTVDLISLLFVVMASLTKLFDALLGIVPSVEKLVHLDLLIVILDVVLAVDVRVLRKHADSLVACVLSSEDHLPQLGWQLIEVFDLSELLCNLFLGLHELFQAFISVDFGDLDPLKAADLSRSVV